MDEKEFEERASSLVRKLRFGVAMEDWQSDKLTDHIAAFGREMYAKAIRDAAKVAYDFANHWKELQCDTLASAAQSVGSQIRALLPSEVRCKHGVHGVDCFTCFPKEKP